MEKSLDALFPLDEELEKKLQEFATLPNYKELLFAHLGPELNKIFEKKKIILQLKIFWMQHNMNMAFSIRKKIYQRHFPYIRNMLI